MVMDVFTQKLGDDLMPRLDGDNTGLVAVQMLDAIQTVVDVLTDNDGGKGWTVTFDPGINAYTDRTSGKRHIVVSGKPLLDAKPGERLDKVAAIMTGFAVHEIGHTKLDFYGAIVKRWPGKRLPITLGNIIEDVVLELRTVERFPGFADHGGGNVFRPTLEWVAKATCPTYPLKWDGSTGHRVNVAGQIVRYRDFVTFSNDPVTQAALNFVEQWATGITASLTPSGCVTLIEQLLDYLKATTLEDDEQPDVPLPKGETPTGETGQTIVDEDDEPEGDGEGEGNGGDGEAEDGDSDSGTEGEGDGEGEGSGSGDDDGDGDGEAEGDDGDGSSGKAGDGNDADHAHRTDAPDGANDGTGKGGSGQAVSETKGEDPDPDEGFDEADLDESFDDLSKGDGYQQRALNEAEQTERVTTRMDAGAFGKMRVVWK